MGGKSRTIANEAPKINSLQIQQSTYGVPIPIVFGKTRVPGDIVDYVDFTATAHKESQSGKGGKTTTTNTTYSYTAAVTIVLGEGQFVSVGTVWASDKQTTLGDLDLSLSYNDAWGYMETYHPDHALFYRDLSVVNGVLDLETTGSLPNLTFEVIGLKPYSSTIFDANPADVIKELLTNTAYGALISTSYLDDMTQYSNYCVASGLFISPALNAQREARQWLADICMATNTAVVWSEGLLKLVPYGDEVVIGNSVTFTPVTTAAYSLIDDDFLDVPICTRSVKADAFNAVQIQFLNRDNDYNIENVEAKDQGDIELYGLRSLEPIQMNFISDIDAARTAAQLILQRKLYIRNTYSFTLGWKYALLEPMDLLAITDSGLGLTAHPVRVVSIEEAPKGEYKIEAEDVLSGIAATILYPVQGATRGTIDYNEPPGTINAPVYVEPSGAITVNNLPELWIGLSGVSTTWGGANIWMSDDGLSYRQLGTVYGNSRQGVLTSAVASSSTDPDISTTMSIDLSSSRGSLASGSQTDVDNYNTLCYLDGELFSYRTAALSSAGYHELSYLHRGLYGTVASTHPVSSKFLRLDDAIFKYPYPIERIGSTIYVKYISFNVWGGGTQSLDEVAAQSYVLSGTALSGGLPDVENLMGFIQSDVTWIKWDVVDDYRIPMYEIRKGLSWENSIRLGQIQTNSFQVIGDDTYWVAAYYRGAYSPNPASLTITGAIINANTLASWQEQDTGWLGTLTGGLVMVSVGAQLVLKLDTSLGLDAQSVFDDILILDALTESVISSGAYEIPAAHIPDTGVSQYVTLGCQYSITMESIAALFSEIPLVSSVVSIAGNFSGSGGAQVYFALAGDDEVFGVWNPFTPGKYICRKVKFMIKLYSNSPDVTVILNDFNFNMDLPDRTVQGTSVPVASAGISVSFSPVFHIVPNLQVTIRNQQEGDATTFPVAATESGFALQVTNSSAPVARIVDWLATGW